MQLTDQQRLRLGTAFIEHVDDLWPEGEPDATPEWIRANVDAILALLELPLRHDGQDARRIARSLALVALAARSAPTEPAALVRDR